MDNESSQSQDPAREGRQRTRQNSRDRLLLGCLTALAGSAIYGAAVWLSYPAVAAELSIGNGIFFFVALAIYLAAQRGWIPGRWAPAFGSLLLLTLSTALVYGFVLVRSQVFTMFLVMQIIGAGCLHSHTRWLAFGLVSAVSAWLVVGFTMFGRDFAVTGGAVTMAGVIALICHVMLMRFIRTFEKVLASDRKHKAELAEALAATRRELGDRQRAEAERERLREQLLHSQKLEAIGTLAGGVAHDMNNMLAAIIGLAELMGEEAGGTPPDGIDQILDVARRGTELTRNLLGFSRRGKYRKEAIELSSVVTGVTQLLSRTLPKGILLAGSNSAEHAVEGDSAQLGQALINLCLNSVDAMKGSGVLRIEVGEVLLAGDASRSIGLAEGRYVTLAVADSGCGMDRETQARMFEPFFTTKGPGRGTGLGLAMVYGTIANHGGAIATESAPGRGTTIVIHLPAIGQAARAEPAVGVPTRHAGGGALILVVDDEPMVRAVTKRTLERVGYRVITAEDGAEALVRFEESGGAVSAVVLDMAMPVMGGAECFRRLREMSSGVRVLLASGYALEQDARDCLAAGALGFLEKPFASARLLEAVAVVQSNRRLDESFAIPTGDGREAQAAGEL
ncbi:MAG TPA: response regulator [Candidatus Acidoferrum sp.]|nr:response regulator [Candidatus Acidoferrum sp.]